MSRNSHCFVPGCSVGYSRQGKATKEDKYSLFQPPADKLSQWSKAIPRSDRQLTVRDRVCELHFMPHHIIRDEKITVGSDTVVIPRIRPKLSEDANPCNFPNLPKYLSRLSKPLRRVIAKHNVQSDITQHNNDSEFRSTSNDQSVTESPVSFSELKEDKHILEQCPLNWISRTDDNNVCFGKIVAENNFLHCIVCVTVSSSLEFIISWHNRKVDILSDSCKIISSQQLLSIIKALDSMSECLGATGDDNSKCLNSFVIQGRLGWFDSARLTWRHIGCSGLVEKMGDRCHACRRYKKILQTARLQNQLKKRGKRKPYVRQCQVKRMKNKLVHFRRTVSTMKRKVKAESKKGIDPYIDKLPVNQQIAIRHCLQEVRVKSSKGMRYEHEWLLSCIILRIKSPKAYTHLRDHNFLSLPSKSTLNRYMDFVRAECGISAECLDILHKKVSTPADRHGILLFDEIKLRTGVKFDIQNLTFSGLVNLDEFTQPKDRKEAADYGLVFMYRPFRGSWTQTVAMFLSKGPTRSVVLSKLMVKVIVALESLDLWVC